MPEFTGEITHVEFAHVPLWLIALAPFVGAVINAVFGRRLQREPILKDLQKRLHIGSVGVSAVALGAMLVAFLLGLASFLQVLGNEPGQRHIYTHAWQMLRIGSLDVNFSFAMDQLSGLMVLIITGVGTLIHFYAAAYMEKEPAYWRFFCYLNLFVFSMLLLVLGDNFIVMFFGWEGVGLCSYLLIGFWYKDYDKASAGMKAFVVNRVGDWGFICGMALLFWGLGGAWMLDTGDYMPDFQARFVPVVKTDLAHHEGGHGEDHGAAEGHGEGHGDGWGLRPGDGDLVVAQNDHAHPPGAGHDHPHEPRRSDEPPVQTEADLRAMGKPGVLTMTTHPGAKVFFGVESVDQLKRAMARIHDPDAPLRACESLESWSSDAANQLSTDCYVTSPFLRKRIPSGRHLVAVVPGDGAVVSGDGNEYAGMLMSIGAGQETVIMPVGPTLTFREIHDQIVTHQVTPEVLIAGNHGHQLTISSDDVDAGKNKTVALSGADHSHVLTLTVADFAEIKAGRLVSVVTDAAGVDHTHTVTVSRPAVFKNNLQSKSVWGIALITLACLCFFVGATGKSAQIPLYVWLPDAMAGPTPVSALIHAATMVTAGVYMIARMNFLFSLTPTASGIIALIGALTALFAATMGFFQYDIKKVLAYSTVSQLGFMFIGVGVGAYWAGVFHLMTHAFFKACLFLASGSVIHGMHHVIHDEAGSQDMRNMGGLRAVMPKTGLAYKLACIAITAVPPGFAGFWSKDEILWKAFNTENTGIVPGWFIYILGLLAAIGTSFYMWRSYYLTFEGKHAIKEIKTKVHESPSFMTTVLLILAGLSVVSGVLFGISSHFTGGIGASILPHEPLFEQWLHPVTAHNAAVIGDAGYPAMYGLMALSVFGAIGAWGLARLKYGADRSKDWAANEQRVPGFELMHNKYYVDEIYRGSIIKGVLKLRLVFGEMDRWIVDGVVNGVGVGTKFVSSITGNIDKYIVDGAVNFVANGMLLAGDKLRGMQTGRIQNYVYGILGGVAALAVLQYFFG
jgi:proton-translocating NADH-quinone oxidoreductase chain L